MNIEQLIAGRGKNRRFVAQGVLAAAQKEAEEAAGRKVMDTLKSMFGQFDDIVDGAVDLTKVLRKQAQAQAKYTEKLYRAVAYFNVHGNPLPAYKLVEDGERLAAQFYRNAGLGELPEADSEAWIVPGDFVPPPVPAA
jgi:hypothetical protein